MCYNIASILYFGFLAKRHVRSYIPSAMEPSPSALEGEVLTSGQLGKSHAIYIYIYIFVYPDRAIPNKPTYLQSRKDLSVDG